MGKDGCLDSFTLKGGDGGRSLCFPFSTSVVDSFSLFGHGDNGFKDVCE